MGTYITGDCHQQFDKLFFFAEKMNLTEKDNIIVLGDMGLCWRHDKQDFNYYIKEWENFENKCNLYWVDGNHENFKLISLLPIENNMRKCSDHIHMLMRGQTYYFEGKKCLAMGGADSIDKHRRTEGLSWWPQEQITNEDIEKVNSEHFDYVFSHCCPTSIFNEYKAYLCTLNNVVDDADPAIHVSENKLEQLKNFIEFDNWWFGHYHVDLQLDDNFKCFFNSFEEME